MPPRAAQLPLLVIQGDWGEARELATITRAQGSPLERQMAVTVLGHLAHYEGNIRHAWSMVQEMIPRGPRSEPEDCLFPYGIEMLRLAVRLALDASDLNDARAWLDAHNRWLDWSGAVRGRAEAVLLEARLNHLAGDQAQAEHCAQRVMDLAANPRQPLVLLHAHRLAGRLALATRRHPDAEQQFRSALSLADACAAPYERAWTLAGLAECALAAGKTTEAQTLAHEAQNIATRLGATRLTTKLEALDYTCAPRADIPTLTTRELDVLRLVAEGMTDAEAAEQLFISPRTVGQHLRSIYNKLGVSSRTAATRIAVENELI